MIPQTDAGVNLLEWNLLGFRPNVKFNKLFLCSLPIVGATGKSGLQTVFFVI